MEHCICRSAVARVHGQNWQREDGQWMEHCSLDQLQLLCVHGQKFAGIKTELCTNCLTAQGCASRDTASQTKLCTLRKLYNGKYGSLNLNTANQSSNSMLDKTGVVFCSPVTTPVVVMNEAVLRRSPMVPYSSLCDYAGRPVVVMNETVLRRWPMVPDSLL